MVSQLEVKNVYKSYQKQIVLKNINLSLPKGIVCCLLGANGGGKSTLLKIMAGLENSDSGAIFFNGVAIDSPANSMVAGHSALQYVNQHFKLSATLSVKDNILLPLRNYTHVYKTEILESVVEIFGLSPLLNKNPIELSGGQQQRVAIVKALVLKPDILLLDEPFSNQDQSNKELLKLQLIEAVRAWETSLIFVSHDPADALSISDTVAVLNEGKIIQIGTPEEIYKQPNSYAVASLSGELLAIPPTWVANSQSDMAYFCRPQHIRIDQESEIMATVKKTSYLGHAFKVFLETDAFGWVFFYDNVLRYTIGEILPIRIVDEGVLAWPKEILVK